MQVGYNLQFCKETLTKLLSNSFDTFEVLSLLRKFGVFPAAHDSSFENTKLILKINLLEDILKVEDSEFYQTLLQETNRRLQVKPSYKCCLVGCLFSTKRHRSYISHLKTVHLNYDSYLCQFQKKMSEKI